MSEQPKQTENTAAEAKGPGGNPNPLTIFMHWCKACGICIDLCPHQVFTADRDGKPIISLPEKCTQCALCWLHCPDLAIISNEK